MSVPTLANLYHWSPECARAGILRRGLLPRTETFIASHPVTPGIGHHTCEDEASTHLAVCLGTTPAGAWSLSGVYSAERGETWDLWEVTVPEDTEIHVRTEYGTEMWEVRALGRIPKSYIWFAGSRVAPQRGSLWHARPV